jgi:hypothetical protein
MQSVSIVHELRSHLAVLDSFLPLYRKGILQQLKSEQHGGIVLKKDDAEAVLLWASQ